MLAVALLAVLFNVFAAKRVPAFEGQSDSPIPPQCGGFKDAKVHVRLIDVQVLFSCSTLSATTPFSSLCGYSHRKSILA